MSNEFKYLFSPLKVGTMEIRNRIGVPGYGTGRTTRDPERWIYHHVEKAKGGAGFIITTDVGIDVGFTRFKAGGYPSARKGGGLMGTAVLTPFLPTLKRTVELVHEQGAKILFQFGHPGAQTHPLWTMGAPSTAPSPIPSAYFREYPHEADIDDIREEMVTNAEGLARAQEIGYDGCELRGAHGYWMQSFLSPYSNKRTDEYGGSLENRMRFLNEEIDLIRKRVGRDFVFGIKISADEFTPTGLTLSDMQEICRILEQRGQIDFFSISVGNSYRLNRSMWLGPDMSYPLGLNVPLSSAIRSVLKKTPVFVGGRINDPVQVEKILADGHADGVLMARELLCDPEWPNKAREGRIEAIRKCMGCTQGCIGRRYAGDETRCVHNPAAGEEMDWGIGMIKRAAVAKNVVVVGGGPAGMKAAEIAAERGHKVTLFEKNNELGGQVNIAAKIPQREEFAEVTRYLKYRVKELGVKVKLGAQATPEMVLAEKPDAVVVAAGSEQVKPQIPGAGPNFVTTWDLLQGKVSAGNKVVITDGVENHWEFCGTAEMLAKQGKQVEMITANLHAGYDLPNLLSLMPLHDRLFKLGVAISPHTVLKEIFGKTVTVANYYTGEERKIENVDTVITVPLRRAADDLYRALKGKVKEIYSIGDCHAPRKVDSAILEGQKIGAFL